MFPFLSDKIHLGNWLITVWFPNDKNNTFAMPISSFADQSIHLKYGHPSQVDVKRKVAASFQRPFDELAIWLAIVIQQPAIFSTC